MTSKVRQSISGRAWLIWIILALFFSYEFMLRTIYGSFQHQLQFNLGLSVVLFAILSSSAYQISYGIMQLPVGFIISRFGLKKSSFFAIVLCCSSIFLAAFAVSFEDALAYRIIMGIGSSFGFLCVLTAVYQWIPYKNFALFIGLTSFIGTLGPMAAGGPISMLSQQNVKYQSVFIVVGVLGLLIAVAILLFVNDRSSNLSQSLVFIEKKEPVIQSIKKIIYRKEMWLIALYSGLNYFALEYFSENSTRSFLGLFGYSESFIGYMITLSWLGYAIGCPLFGYISDTIKRRRFLMIIASLILCIGLVAILYATNYTMILILGFCLLGVGASGQSIGFAMIAEESQSQYISAGMGFNNTMCLLTVAIMGPIIGYILIVISGGSDVSHFTIADYRYSLFSIIVLAFIAFLISIFFY